MEGNLGAHDMGEVSLLGLDEFGEPVGPSAMWGALLGGGVSTGTAIGVRMIADANSSLYRNSELIGAAAGVLTGGALMAFKGTRHMGVGALLTAVVTGVPRLLEFYMGDSQKALDAANARNNMNGAAYKAWIAAGHNPKHFDLTTNAAGYDSNKVQYLEGTSMARIPSLNGFGLPSMEQVPSLNGLAPQLLSAAQGSINNNPAVQGLPTELAAKLQGLARNYGTSSVG